MYMLSVCRAAADYTMCALALRDNDTLTSHHGLQHGVQAQVLCWPTTKS